MYIFYFKICACVIYEIKCIIYLSIHLLFIYLFIHSFIYLSRIGVKHSRAYSSISLSSELSTMQRLDTGDSISILDQIFVRRDIPFKMLTLSGITYRCGQNLFAMKSQWFLNLATFG